MLWYSLKAPWWGAFNEYPQHTFLCWNKKKKNLTDTLSLIVLDLCIAAIFISHFFMKTYNFVYIRTASGLHHPKWFNSCWSDVNKVNPKPGWSNSNGYHTHYMAMREINWISASIAWKYCLIKVTKNKQLAFCVIIRLQHCSVLIWPETECTIMNWAL